MRGGVSDLYEGEHSSPGRYRPVHRLVGLELASRTSHHPVLVEHREGQLMKLEPARAPFATLLGGGMDCESGNYKSFMKPARILRLVCRRARPGPWLPAGERVRHQGARLPHRCEVPVHRGRVRQQDRPRGHDDHVGSPSPAGRQEQGREGLRAVPRRGRVLVHGRTQEGRLASGRVRHGPRQPKANDVRGDGLMENVP